MFGAKMQLNIDKKLHKSYSKTRELQKCNNKNAFLQKKGGKYNDRS